MVKTLLKSVLIILVLSGLFFFALRFWEERNAKTTAPVRETVKSREAPPALTLNTVDVTANGNVATIQIGEVYAGYRVDPSPDGKSLRFEFPPGRVNLLRTSFSSPHPLISRIDVSQTPSTGNLSQAKVRVDLTKDVEFKDRMFGNTLYVDLSPKAKASPLAEILSPRKPTKKVASAKPRPKKSAPRRQAEEESLEDLLGSPSDAPPPPPPTPVAKAPKGDILDDFLGETDKDAGLPPMEEPRADTKPPEVAAVPKDFGKFDSSKIRTDLPRVTALSIRDEGGGTAVVIDRESKIKFKILPMRNPSRIVIDFQNALNALQPEYSSGGSRVSRVTTEQFRGVDETITRVIVYVNGQASEYQKETDGNSLILKIP